MTRVVRRWVWLAVLVFPVSVFAQGFGRMPDDQPNAETLRRLAEQLAKGNQQTPSNIDPELMKLAAEYLKKNPEILKDPNFQQQVQQWQQQAKSDPQGFAKQFQQQNPGLTPEQIKDLQDKFQQSNPNGFTPPPGITPPLPPNPTGQTPPKFPGQGPQPAQTPTTQPGQTNPQPGQQNPFQPNGQSGQSNPWQTAEQKAQGKQEYQQAVGMWEKNFGSIDKTPALKQSLVDIFSGDGKSPWDGKGGNNNPFNGGSGTNPGQQKPWWDTGNNPNGGNQSGFVGWLKNTSSNPPTWWKSMTGNWNQSNMQPPNIGNSSGWTPPQYSPSGFNPSGISGGDIGSGALPIVILVVAIAIAVGGFLVWRYWPQIQAKLNQPKPIPGLGPWTIDPRQVTDRDTLVRAFEYLSVLICGDGARVWNHQTIADAFRENVPGAAPFADPLAHLYALARYSPANEAISPQDIAEARGYLCRLAGVQG